MTDESKLFPLIIPPTEILANNRKKSIFHVKLTDACRTALDNVIKSRVHKKISTSSKNDTSDFIGNLEIRDSVGALKFGDGLSSNSQNFRFTVSDISSELAKGQLQTILQTGGNEENGDFGGFGDQGLMKSIGQITQRIKILTTDKESFESTKQKARREMDQAKNQAEKIGSMKLKTSGSSSKAAQKILQKLAATKSTTSSDKILSRSDRPSTPVNALNSANSAPKSASSGGISAGLAAKMGAPGKKYGDLARKSLRQRVIQHLALKPSRPADLLVRLTKEGLADEDRAVFETTLNEVAQLKQSLSPGGGASVSGEFELRPSSWSDVSTNWPHYSKWDLEMVKKSVAAKLIQNSSSASSRAPATAATDLFIGRKDDVGKTRVVPPPPPSSRRSENVPSSSTTSSNSNNPIDSSNSPPSSFSSPLDSIIPEILSQEGGRRRIAQKRRLVPNNEKTNNNNNNTSTDNVNNSSSSRNSAAATPTLTPDTHKSGQEMNSSTNFSGSPSELLTTESGERENVKRAKTEKTSVQVQGSRQLEDKKADKGGNGRSANGISSSTLNVPVVSTMDAAAKEETPAENLNLSRLSLNSSKCLLQSSNTQNKLPSNNSNNDNNNNTYNHNNHTKDKQQQILTLNDKESEYLSTPPSVNLGVDPELINEEIIDYYAQFPPVYNEEDRQKYKQIFDTDYPKYMRDYGELEKVIILKDINKLWQRLDKLKDNQKQQSNEYKSIERDIERKYIKFAAENSAMFKCKSEHDRLRSKLAVLKERIAEFDYNRDSKDIIRRYL